MEMPKNTKFTEDVFESVHHQLIALVGHQFVDHRTGQPSQLVDVSWPNTNGGPSFRRH